MIEGMTGMEGILGHTRLGNLERNRHSLVSTKTDRLPAIAAQTFQQLMLNLHLQGKTQELSALVHRTLQKTTKELKDVSSICISGQTSGVGMQKKI